MRYVEQFGQLIDTDGDGIKESYYYVKPKDAYRDASNGNLLAGMSLPNDGSAVDAVRYLFQASPPLFKKHAGEPRITHADYPAVMVPVARYDAAAKVLRFQLVAGDKAPEAATQVELANCQGFTSVTLDGKAFTDHTPGKAAGSLLIAAPPPTNTPQVWEVAFGA